jgi:hypothetical protein
LIDNTHFAAYSAVTRNRSVTRLLHLKEIEHIVVFEKFK